MVEMVERFLEVAKCVHVCVWAQSALLFLFLQKLKGE